MSDSDIKNKDIESFDDVDDDIDEELLALAGPPPSLKYGLFTLVVVGLLIGMMVWFLPELEYTLNMGDKPIPLGDAADIDLDSLEPNSFVSLDGLPLVSKGIEYKEGIKWFSMSDNVRHFFPLVGQPNIYVQWKEPDDYKAYRDPSKNPTKPGPPSHFEGHLVKRADLVGTNFERILVFYDCLKLHPLRRCNYCLGKSDLNECREFFTCAEKNKPEQCVELLKHIDDPESVDIEKVGLSVKEHRIEVALMGLEELAVRVSKLDRNSKLKPKDRDALDRIKRDILALNIEELKIRASSALGQIRSMDDSSRESLEKSLGELEKKREEEESLTRRQKLLNEYADLGQALENTVSRLTEMKVLVEGATKESFEKFGAWKLTAEEKDAKKLADEVARLEAFLYEHVEKQESKAETVDPAHQKIADTLEAICNRVRELQSKINGLGPGTSEAFDKWALKPDVLGSIPAELKDERVLVSLSKLEKMLEGVDTSQDDLKTLIERVNQGIDEINTLKKSISELASLPGMRELEAVKPLLKLEESLKKSPDPAEATMEIGRITLLLMDKNLYQSSLKGMPEEMKKLEKVLDSTTMGNITARVDEVYKRFDKDDWVLFDKDPPFEKSWVLIIYAILLVLVIVNVRKLWRFFSAWKA